uniref:Alpha-mann_mid domain-containing protein n=1 Tax=Elaeophora elaphi TaxID=1147741 RepID=A0A0R3RWX2_9BILA
MSKLHAIFLTTVFGTYTEMNESEVRVKLVKKRNTCVVLQRLNNATIKVRGHSIQLMQNKRNATKHLDVFVVLHSHVDPGWLHTFEEYYSSVNHSVRKILNNVVNSLRKHPNLRFIWSEISFLERWWSEANITYQKYFKSLIDEGRLEISSGHWVMNDEATPYFWEVIENIIVGHRYVQEILNITPTTSWSVDPFGHGLMMPYLMMLADINQLVIGRINSNIKHMLKLNHQLHFRWAQNWDPKLRWAPFINVLPNTYYTVSSACGTDEMICCQFDVSKTSRGERMANQYRSLQTFYNSEAVLVAAGDDFLYSHPDDLEIVHRVYTALFKYINRNYDRFHMKVQFGTVVNYFNALRESTKRSAAVLDGDFFPYMDDPSSSAKFWTGFYNHRPYFKCFERIIQRELRLVDLLSVTTRKYPNSEIAVARRNLALSTHHDAITGTSKRHVMNDYMLRLWFQTTVSFEYLINDSVKTKGMFLRHKILSFADDIKSYKIQIVNQKAFSTMELIKMNISSSSVIVTHNNKPLTIQLVPLLDQPNLFELVYDDGSMETNFSIYFNQISDYGGAYTIVSELPFQNISNKGHELPVIVIQGPIYSSIWQQLSSQLTYRITIIHSTDVLARSLQIDVFTNVNSMPGHTFFMNLNCNIENGGDHFYTDVNGIYDKRMELEANIYPITTEAMIEDDKLRCTILAAQSTGVTSKLGVLTLMIDREMYNDDGKGLPYYQASQSYPTHLKYRIIFEPKMQSHDDFHCKKRVSENESVNNSLPIKTTNTLYHSQLVQQTMEELLYPAALLSSTNISQIDDNGIISTVVRLPRLPDNIQLITARYIAQNTILISMRQLPYDCSVKPYCRNNTKRV